MNTAEIIKLLSNNNTTKNCFRGVYPIDTLPNRVYKKPASFVVNTDPSYLPGTHWVAVFFPVRGHAEFFDSFGRPPFDKRFKKFLSNNSTKYIYNRVKLQDNYSLMCGKYCCVYLSDRCSGNSMKSFVNRFINNMPQLNDQLVGFLFRTLFKKKKRKNQRATKRV